MMKLKKPIPLFSETCVICLHSFKSLAGFNQDRIRHEQMFVGLDQPVNCPLCSKTIDNKYCVTSHFDAEHSDLNVTCCCGCLQVIPNGADRLRRHILQAHHSAMEVCFATHLL